MGNQQFAPAPPLGWNSWDCYGMTITEAELLENGRVLREKLYPFGFRYLVMDAGWFNPRPELARKDETPEVELDEVGRLRPVVSRFPSAAADGGLTSVARALHAQDLRLGLHMMRGIPRAAVERNTPILGTSFHARDIARLDDTCIWNQEMFGVDMSKPGAQAYYDSVARLLAEWGVDFVKADDMTKPYHAAEIEGLSQALRRSGRDILLSLSPGGGELTDHAQSFCEMRRASNDLWDTWENDPEGFAGLKGQFEIARQWQRLSGPGHWIDLDMLPLGRISLRGPHGPAREARFTHDERITMLTLWAVFQSPWMLGGDLITLGDDTLRLITNAEVLAVNQRGRNGREVLQRGEQLVWCADMPETGSTAVAVFNLGDQAQSIELTSRDLPEIEGSFVRDLWMHENGGRLTTKLGASVPAHGARLFSLSRSAAG
ncbi:MAG TPA: glycoside hydrolase family 27 protein [Polyangiaceae bacterium]|nr:glycoside hydrolase family 27 protein [Polyangiaceae bacterium]